MNTAFENLLLAAIACALYGWICLAIWQRERIKHIHAAHLVTPHGGQTPLLVAHASQTGTAASLAMHSAEALQTAGVDVVLRSFAQLEAASLQSAAGALFVVSTYGEGDPPDPAAHFVATTMRESAVDLSGLRYGLLVLGDRAYRNFCGFGRELDEWLQRHGAQPRFTRIEVDNDDPEALHAWRQELGHIAATTDLPEWQDVPFEPWVLRARTQLNPGSAGAPVFHLELEPQQGAASGWQAGDLLQVLVPQDSQRPRDYSIASVPADGAVHLLVRTQVRPDGSIGGASGWLTQDVALGTVLRARLRAHSQFHIDGNAARDLILIGNGTGIAGLRAHLRARAQLQAAGEPVRRNWLLFGERNAAHDALYADELAQWRARGLLTQLDLVYSRDGSAKRYVQDQLRASAQQLREWVDAGAAIYVCGSLEGMAEGVAAVLREELGEPTLLQLQQEGRYRRDVY